MFATHSDLFNDSVDVLTEKGISFPLATIAELDRVEELAVRDDDVRAALVSRG
jgi:hypothetical protein